PYKELSNNDGRTTIFASHNINTAEQLCSCVMHLCNGVVVEIGSVSQVIGSCLNKMHHIGSEQDISIAPGVALDKLLLINETISSGENSLLIVLYSNYIFIL
ncbi:MAG: hypothetical protein ICV51_01850, partial [Flavisolibacter sp.]|nr:hypothetical protein [Flavisolibacter sp.]